MTNDEKIDTIISFLLNAKEVKSISIIDAKRIFFNSLKIKNVKKETIHYYKKIFYSIDDFFAQNNITETSQINDELLRKIITDGLNNNLSANYINKKINCIKYMIQVLYNLDYINEVKFKTTKLKETDQRIEDISLNDMVRIIDYSKKLSLKTYLIVLLLYTTGVRRNELVNIKLENINYEHSVILLETTKTSQIRVTYFPEELIDLIKNYINQYKPKTFLFEGIKVGEAMSSHSINIILEKIKSGLNLNKLSAHMFRHTFGTTVYTLTHDIELTRELLGHSSYEMTKRYIHNSKEKLKETYNSINPLKLLKS